MSTQYEHQQRLTPTEQQQQQIPQQQMGQQQMGQQQMGQQQMGQQQMGQGQQKMQPTMAGETMQGGSVAGGGMPLESQQIMAGDVAVSSEFTITDPHYQPQERILNMTPDVKAAFMSQYELTRWDDKPVNDYIVEFLKNLEMLEGVRVAFFPVPREPGTQSSSGPGGDVTHGGKRETTTQESGSKVVGVGGHHEEQQLQRGEQAGMPPQQQQQQQLQQQQQQQQQRPLHDAFELAKPHTVRTTKNFIIQGTSSVHSLDLTTGPLSENHWEPSSLTPFKNGQVLTGDLLFINVSQLPSQDNRVGRTNPLKPCMHLFLFSPASPAPIIIVERYLREKGRILRVFNGALELFGKIECLSTFMGRKKTIITGPDQESTLFTIKNTKTFTSSADYIIKKGKKRVGMITSRYSSLEKTASELACPYDVFFPKSETSWPHRAMLIVSALYMDYLWGE